MQVIEAVCPDCLGEVLTEPCRRCFGAGSVIQFKDPLDAEEEQE